VVNLVTVVGRNTHILPHMLKHYENKVDRMFVVVYRQSDNDTILEEIEELGIKPFWIVTEPKFHWERVTYIYNTVKIKHPNDWWIVSDDDELQLYPEPIEDIIKESEKKGYEFITGGFLDRIGKDGTFPKVERDTDLHKEFPLGGFFRYPMSGACPNKVTLMKGTVNVTPGQHYVDFGNGKNSWGVSHPKRFPVQEVFTQVHHFKWDSTVVDRLREVASVKENYTFWKEYNKMYLAIKDNSYQINVNNPEFMFEELKEFSYISYNNWSVLRNKIVLI